VITLPEWLEAVPDGPAKTRATKRFYMKLISLYATENVTLADLADLLDMNYQTLKSQSRHICLTHDVRTRIHRLVGQVILIPPHII
jgi:hypothetical protein